MVTTGILTSVAPKLCRRCGIIKPPNDFYRHGSSPDGLQKDCKTCQLDQRRASRRKAAEPRKPRPPSALPNERWLPVAKYEGLYSISNFGRVRSEGRVVQKIDGTTQAVHARLLSAVPDRKGYLRVNLFRENIGATCYIHQLMMEAFVGPAPLGLLIRHLNGDQSDNRLPNLCYGTDSENQLDTVRHGTHHNSRKTHCPQHHPYTDENTYIHRGRRRCRTCMRARRAKR